MSIQKLSVSLSEQQYHFIEDFQKQHHIKSRSKVISEALRLLQQVELEACYKAANQEIDDAWEPTAGDGLEHETW